MTSQSKKQLVTVQMFRERGRGVTAEGENIYKTICINKIRFSTSVVGVELGNNLNTEPKQGLNTNHFKYKSEQIIFTKHREAES